MELDKKLKGKYASVMPYIDETDEGFSGSSTIKDLEILMQLVYLYFDAPRFDESMCNLVVKEIKNQLKFLSSNPQIMFVDTLIKACFQNDIRKTQIPDEKFMDAVTLERVKRVYLDRFADASDFTFTFVGNVNEETFIPLMEKYLGNLPSIKRTETFKNVSKAFSPQTQNISIEVGMENQGNLGILFAKDGQVVMTTGGSLLPSNIPGFYKFDIGDLWAYLPIPEGI